MRALTFVSAVAQEGLEEPEADDVVVHGENAHPVRKPVHLCRSRLLHMPFVTAGHASQSS
jgi:hypothetical protein